ncbi:phage tail protein [Paracoccus limosus]|uniref:Phage tail protein n=1 Tax=Paracoccus limosus TaxID=913252 RepID=A0A844H206_9RHOB|nr:phage tail protein [Paracoccus limosus]
MTPAFRILVDGADRSTVIADRLLSILITDEDGTKSDRVEIEIDNRDRRVAFPKVEAQIEVSLGFQGKPLSLMGRYAVDGVSGRGPVRALTITATAADLKGDIRAPRTRGWTNRSLPDIAATIAGEAGLIPVIGESLRAVRWPFLAQTAESNLHFLTRLAAELDATCKPAGGALVVQRRGEGKTAAGDTLVPPVITPRRLSDWSWSWRGRTVYRAAEAEWTETGTGVTHKIKVGSGTPLKKIRHPYATEAEATRAAESALSGAGRSGLEVSGTLSGFEPGLLGGGLIDLQGLEPVLDGRWHLKSVSHRLDIRPGRRNPSMHRWTAKRWRRQFSGRHGWGSMSRSRPMSCLCR